MASGGSLLFLYRFREHIRLLAQILSQWQIELQAEDRLLLVRKDGKTLRYQLVFENAETADGNLPLRYDLLLSSTRKIAASMCSRLGQNKVVYARQCALRPVSKKDAVEFLDRYHLMNSTSSAFRLGLFFEDELLALATFSKGRKMNRLPEDKRSFELIRFCSRERITIAGGLSRLVKHFAQEKKAGDIMTYIDTSTSDGRAFFNAGFRLHSQLPPQTFLVDACDGHLTSWQGQHAVKGREYLYTNRGNLKMVFRCEP